MYICSKIRCKYETEQNKRHVGRKRHLSDMACKTAWEELSTVNCYARNKYQPDLETLLEISKILQVDLKDLITDEDERE